MSYLRSVRLYRQLFVGGLMSYLRYLCLFVYSGVHYSYGPRKLNIILTQLRCNASFLNYDLCKVKMLSNASCNCGAPCENSHQAVLELYLVF
jgi:hypothetical protein